MRPYSAEKLAVLMETSSMKSIPTLLIWLLLLPESMLKPPSTMSRLALVRLPLTEVLIPRPVMMSRAFRLLSRRGDPGMRLASWRYWRPFRARFWTCSRSTTLATSPETVFTVSPATVTSMTSLMSPTPRVKSAVTRPSATRVKPVLTAFLNPLSSALTV